VAPRSIRTRGLEPPLAPSRGWSFYVLSLEFTKKHLTEESQNKEVTQRDSIDADQSEQVVNSHTCICRGKAGGLR
jgi:hypothetical protein